MTEWNIQFTRKAAKQARQLDEHVFFILSVLVENLKTKGPMPGNRWRNYGKLYAEKKKDRRHCHLIKGSPTYICCWEVYHLDKYIEVYYVGTHENAPY